MKTAPDASKRPALRYHGGKWKLAPWIISNMPQHRTYVEPFGGAASVLLRKPRCYAEIYNDLDGEIVNLFRVLRDPVQARDLVRLIELTPFARAEFDLSYIATSDPIEQARRTVTRSFMGFASTLTGRWSTGFRNNSKHSGTTPAHDWINYPDALRVVIERLRGVVVENKPAAEVIKNHDSKQTLHYVDPPYVFSTRHARWAGNAYRHEMTDDDHRELAWVLRPVKGMVMLSGYPCALYDDELYSDWGRVEKDTHADGANERVEVLWLSPKTVAALGRPKQAELF